jgi:hypothetical protein
MSKIKFINNNLSDFPLRSEDPVVYIASTGEITKVGCTRHPLSRIASIQSKIGEVFREVYISQPHKLAFCSERKIHKILDKYRLHGEWFDISTSEILEKCSFSVDGDSQNVAGKKVNLNQCVAIELEEKLIEINIARLKAKKKTLNRNDVIALAIENLTVQMGVEK